MIPELQLAIACFVYIACFLLVAGIVLAAFLLPRFLRDAKKDKGEFEETKKRVEESIARGASQFSRGPLHIVPARNLNINDTADAERIARETARRLQKGGCP